MRSFAAFATAVATVMPGITRVPAAATDYTIVVGPVESGITFGTLVNAPNGHISFAPHGDGYRVWVSGRLLTDTGHLEGGFLLDVPDLTPDAFAAANAKLVLGHQQSNCDPTDTSFDRNYAALNAVVPGVSPGFSGETLLGFYDAEYHVDCPDGQPLLSSIGLAISLDGGRTWGDRQQVVQGRDEAKFGFQSVTSAQAADGTPKMDDGASGPSAIVRSVDGVPYVYVYYADRTPMLGGDDSIYVARAPLSTNGTQGNWRSWTGTDWRAQQELASPIVVPAPHGLALQPHVSWNTALGRWLMVFKSSNAFDVTTSMDGINWTTPSILLQDDPQDGHTGFPTLVSVMDSQQITSETGWLYYSAQPPDKNFYTGRRAAFRIQVE